MERPRQTTAQAEVDANRILDVTGDAGALHSDIGSEWATFEIPLQLNSLEELGSNSSPEHRVTQKVQNRTK